MSSIERFIYDEIYISDSMVKSRYMMFREQGLCGMCGKDVDLEISKTHCISCYRICRKAKVKHYHNHKDSIDANKIQRRRDKVKAGICGVCMNNPISDECTYICELCREKKKYRGHPERILDKSQLDFQLALRNY